NNGQMGYGINDGYAIISWEPFVISICIILAATIIFYIFMKLNFIEIQFYSIMFSTWTMFFVILVSGLLYPDKNNYQSEMWKIFVRLILVVISFIIVFFPLNKLILFISLRTGDNLKYVNKIIKEEEESIEFFKSNESSKLPKEDKKTTIEVEL
ncbi:MAG: hypothetical protein ACRC4L_04235, partial [Mycoplasma sp.]